MREASVQGLAVAWTPASAGRRKKPGPRIRVV